MLLPIYDHPEFESQAKSILEKSDSVNTSLAYERYYGWWEWKNERISKKDEQIKFFSKITKILKRCNQVDRFLSSYHERMNTLITKKSGHEIKLVTNWRFLTGLGQPHPAEVGFRWDKNLGVPFLPGSSIKGALRAWMRVNKSKEEIKSSFGSSERVGSIIFLDAYPSKRPVLDIDILNPHYGEYYKDPEKNPPADYYSPIPVYFLTVAAGTEFVFRFICKESESSEKIAKYLLEAADTLGFGAKTSVGYGQFKQTSSG
jgi:CRISPR-associated protein Cmr6